MRRIVLPLLMFVIACGLAIPVLGAAQTSASMTNFQRSVSYTRGQFSDVDENRWYGAQQQGVIKDACELGIMNGMGDSKFLPDGNLKICEAIKMAAVIHSIYEGDNVSFDAAKEPWYNDYVGYAISNGIIGTNEYAKYETYATRSETAHIFAKALPAEAYLAINAVEGIRDVWTSRKISVSGAAEYADILLLYRAGVLTGDAGTHAFRPYDTITRAETAAIITRVALLSERQHFTILPAHAVNTVLGAECTVYNSAGDALVLGPQSWKQVLSFFGGETPVIRNTGSDDVMNTLEADFFFGTVKYLASKFNPDSIYLWSIIVKKDGYRLSNGLVCGSMAQKVLDSYGTEMQWCDYDTAEYYAGGVNYATGDKVTFDVSAFNGTLKYNPTYYDPCGKLEDCTWPNVLFETAGGCVTSFSVNCASN